MALLDSLINLLSSIESDRIAVHDERCVVMRNRNAGCLRCAAACTTGALQIVAGELAVHPERCIGCGTCAAACPTSAIEVRDPDDDALTAALKRSIVATGGRPVIACAKAACAARAALDRSNRAGGLRGALGLSVADGRRLRDEALVEVPCLGRVDESLLAAMAAFRCAEGTLVCHHCSGCEHETGGVQVMDVIESAESLLGAFGSPVTFAFTDEMPDFLISPADEAPAADRRTGCDAEATDAPAEADGTASANAPADPSRRAFFAEARATAQTLAADAAANALGLDAEPAPEPVRPRYRKVEADGALSRFVPTRRTRLYNYLARLGEPAAEAVRSRIIGTVAIDGAACNACRMCAVFCPTGALSRTEGEGVWGLLHRPAACVQCRSCENLCPKGAITVSDTVPAAQFMGREAVVIAMEKPAWEPNRPDSMYNKIHTVIGEDLEMRMF